MVKKLVLWIIGYSFGMQCLTFLSSFKKGDVSFIISELMYNPNSFFIGMVCFFISFLALSALFRSGIEEVYIFFKKKKISFFSFILSLNVISCFYLLFRTDLWITFCLLIFTIIYGMISVDLKGYLRYQI